MLAPLRSARLILRTWRDEDLAANAVLNADAAVRRFYPSRLTQAESDAEAARFLAHWDERRFGFWVVEIPGITSFAGFVGLQYALFDAPFTPAVEIGWRLLPAYWGQGYATEAARMALAFGFDELGLNEIVAFTTPANLPSQAVMRRIRMTHDPHDDFDHPRVPPGHPLQRHVLYRLPRTHFVP